MKDKTDQRTFAALVHTEGNFTYIALPFSPRENWGVKPPYHVIGTVNGIAVKGTLGASGQAYFLRLSAAWLRDSGIAPGSNVTVRLSLDGSR